MNPNLGTLCNVPGVLGAAVFSQAGQVVEHKLNPPFDAVLIDEVLKTLRGLFERWTLGETPVKASTVRLEDGGITFRQLGSFGVVVLTGAKVNPSMLNVALKALDLKLKRATAAQHISQSQSFGALSIDLNASGAANAVPPKVVKEVIAAFAQSVGPIARMVFKKELKRLGTTSSAIPLTMYSELVSRLAKRIENTQDRKTFLKNVKDLL